MKIFWTRYSWIAAGLIALALWILENHIGHQALQRTIAPGISGPLAPEPKLEGAGKRSRPESSSVDVAASEERNYPSPETLEILENQLNKSLADKGFSPHEVEVFFNILRSRLLSADPSDALREAKVEAAGTLQLSPERTNPLSEGLESALEETGGAFTFQDWEDCLSKRNVKYKADSCDLDILDSLKKTVLANTANNRINYHQARNLQKVAQEAAAQSVEQCKREINSALEFFAVDVGHCE